MIPPAFAGKVLSQTGKGADFARYRTYEWFAPRVLTGTGIVEDHPVNPLVKEVVNRQLQQRGLTEVSSGADLQISTWVLTESVPQVEKALFAGGMENIYATPIATIGRYNRQGTLVVNLIDAQSKKSAWSAMATESIPDKDVITPDDARKKLEKAAGNMFKKFPVKLKN
jgi:uncharacterized protein DUF4136